jgi:hypothetical protein
MFAFLKVIIQRVETINLNNGSSSFANIGRPRNLTPILIIDEEVGEEPSQRCSICNEALNLPRADGTIEHAAMLPCAHIFGSLCITQWLDQHALHKDCPQCRRRIVYRKCGHSIRPWELDRAPTPIAETEMPENCILCEEDGGGAIGAQLRDIRNRMEAEERALEGLKLLPGLFGSASRSVRETDLRKRVEESRSFWRQEIERLTAELYQNNRVGW